MKIMKVNDRLSVATQPQLEEFAEIARLGFKSVINNRPDGEEVAQPDSPSEESEARKLGLAYRQIPIRSGVPFGPDDVDAMQKAMDEMEGPVLAHCRSGTRSLNLWAAGEVIAGRMRADELIPLGQKVGVDLTGAYNWIAHFHPDKV
ncbi:MAG: TIGR01244 family phosphatase [Pseudorhodoplanes sp.]|nr:TIGR01244 family phosphatase [Pseudorhodoplanes sp.]